MTPETASVPSEGAAAWGDPTASCPIAVEEIVAGGALGSVLR